MRFRLCVGGTAEQQIRLRVGADPWYSHSGGAISSSCATCWRDGEDVLGRRLPTGPNKRKIISRRAAIGPEPTRDWYLASLKQLEIGPTPGLQIHRGGVVRVHKRRCPSPFLGKVARNTVNNYHACRTVEKNGEDASDGKVYINLRFCMHWVKHAKLLVFTLLLLN